MHRRLIPAALLFVAIASSALAQDALRLVAPNGREQFVPGDTVTIEWTGVHAAEPVRLSFSADSGATWSPIASAATGLRHAWRVPVVAATGNALVRVERWEPRVVDSVTTFPRHTGFISGGSFSPDGSRLVTLVRRPGHPDNADIYLFDAATREQQRQISIRGRDIGVVEWTPDGAALLIGGTIFSASDTSARLVDAKTGAVRQVFRGHTTRLSSGAIAPGGLIAATGGFDLTVRIWDVATGAQVARIDSFRASVGAIAFSPDGWLMATAGGVGEGVRIFEAGTWRELVAIRGDSLGRSYGAVKELSFDPTGARLLGATEAFGGIMWDVSTGRTIGSFVQRRGEMLRASFSPSGRWIAGGRDTLSIWSAATGERLLHERAVRYPLGMLDFTADGASVVVGGRDSIPRVFHLGGPVVEEDRSDRTFGIIVPAGVGDVSDAASIALRVERNGSGIVLHVDGALDATVTIEIHDLLGRRVASSSERRDGGGIALALAPGSYAITVTLGRSRLTRLVHVVG